MLRSPLASPSTVPAERRLRAQRPSPTRMTAVRTEGAATDSSRDIFDDPPTAADYVLRDGLRFVAPYYFDYYAFVKPRWVGRGVVEVFTAEFKGRDKAYYAGAQAAGRLRVEETAISQPRRRGGPKEEGRLPAEAPPGALLRDGQRIRHFVHRHEPPVLDTPVHILAVTDALVAVAKPASMPVHPTGQYRKNSVMGLLAAEHAATLGRLCPVHRLDRAVSGLLVFARGAAAADAVRLQITGGDVTKEYIALVRGCFPGGPACVIDAPLRFDFAARRTAVGEGPGSKVAATAVTLLAVSLCGTRSLVACRPLTGRTHQIRAHLQHAGYPIANDSAYGGTLGAAAAGDPPPVQPEAADAADDAARFAPRPRVEGQAQDVIPLFLHACRYAGTGWSFAAPPPPWAGLLRRGEGATEGVEGDVSFLPTGLWDGLPAEALRRAAAGGGVGEEA